ncbi:MAG: hypothetical protein HQL95_09305 [Magnetococcales bacterium]|nr:hypothetical protein [Magnetococcales bacterium]
MHTKATQGEIIRKLPKAGPVSLLAALPYMARIAMLSRRWKRELQGGVSRTLHLGGHSHAVKGSRRCPDGQRPHPSVCHRGWRGEVCQGCPAAHFTV